jgi:hypothetical protein
LRRNGTGFGFGRFGLGQLGPYVAASVIAVGAEQIICLDGGALGSHNPTMVDRCESSSCRTGLVPDFPR